MTYREFVAIIEANGFVALRQKGSHRAYRGHVGGWPQIVVVAMHRMKDDIPKGTLSQMIRQTGLPKSLFR